MIGIKRDAKETMLRTMLLEEMDCWKKVIAWLTGSVMTRLVSYRLCADRLKQ